MDNHRRQLHEVALAAEMAIHAGHRDALKARLKQGVEMLNIRNQNWRDLTDLETSRE